MWNLTWKGKSRFLYTSVSRGGAVRHKNYSRPSVGELGQPAPFFLAIISPVLPSASYLSLILVPGDLFHTCRQLTSLTCIVFIYHNLIPFLLIYTLPKKENVSRLNVKHSQHKHSKGYIG